MAEDMEKAAARVREGYEAFSRGDFDVTAALMHPDIVWNPVIEVETPIRGREAVRANMEPMSFADQRAEILETEIAGDCVVARTIFTAKGAGSGIEMSIEGWHLWRIRDGQAIEFRAFDTREEAVAAAEE